MRCKISKLDMNFPLNRRIYLFFALILAGQTGAFSLSVDLRRISDNALSSNIRFTPAQSNVIYTQGESYADIQCTPEDAVGLKIFSNNRDWQGGSGNPDRAGLVNNPPTRRVPVYWTLSNTQQAMTMNASNEASWKILGDQNTNGFSGLDPVNSDITCPSTGRGYVYFAAKMNSTTSPTYYTTSLYFSNVPVGGSGGGGGQNGNPGIEEGFGSFNTVFRPSQNPSLDIPINISRDGKIDVVVYGRNGERISQLFSGEKTAGHHVLTWDGRTEDNKLVSSGIYFVTFKIGKTYRKKIVVIR